MSDGKLPEDTGWSPIIPTSGDGERSAGGKIEMIKGNESRPCMMCTSWEKDDKRLVQHLIARGLKPNPDGTFTSPIARDMRDKTPMILDPKRNGWCRREGSVTEDLASCEKWQPVRLINDLRSRIR